MWTRTVVFTCLLAAVVTGCGGGAQHHAARAAAAAAPVRHPHVRRPNVVMILTDDLTGDLLRYMPHVRALERHGVSFSRYVVSDSLCCPSRASILTGDLPHDTGVYGNYRPTGGFFAFRHHQDTARTFADALHSNGYRTALMGKYLNGYEPPAGVPRGWSGWDGAGSAGYAEYRYTLDEDGRPIYYGNQPRDYLTTVLQHRGESFIDSAAHADQPFLLELATFAPHKPAIPAPQDVHRFPHLHAPRGGAWDAAGTHAPPWLAGRAPLGPGEIQFIDAGYRDRARSVLAVDRLLAGVERHLAADGLDRDTYVIFTSDNGFHMGEHRLLPGKQTAFDTDIRVPLVVAGPDIRPGTRIGALAQNTDLAPTFEALAGTRGAPATDGRSLVPLLHGHLPGDWRRAALIEHHHPNWSPVDPDRQHRRSGNPPTYEALRTHRWTYVEYVDGERELYDDRRDPAQTVDVYRDVSAALRARLHRRLLTLEHCHGPACARSSAHVA